MEYERGSLFGKGRTSPVRPWSERPCNLAAAQRGVKKPRRTPKTYILDRQASSLLKMLEMVEDLDDVQQEYSTADMPDALLATL